MKWLLITTGTRKPDRLNTNVGDEFARMGVMKVIQEVDPKAQFDILDKEDANAWKPRKFDKAVVCGMPLFWSLPSFDFPGRQTCSMIWWWPRLMRGWPSAVREHFLVFGVGHVYVDRILSLHDYASAIEEVLNRSYALIAREPILDHPQIVESVCPSAFVMLGMEQTREVPICNLMPDAGHFGYLAGDRETWDKWAKQITEILLPRDFVFMAHTEEEVYYAIELGWPKNRVKLPLTADGYFHWFSRASCYFGNRLHGAAVCAGAGIKSWAVSHDSRLGMVTRLGGKATRVSEAGPELLTCWLDEVHRPVPTPFDVTTEFVRMVKLVRGFSEAVAKEPWTA